MLFSTLTSSRLAAVLTVGVAVAGRFTDVVRNMREVAPGTPPWLVEALYALLPNFRNFDFKDRVAYGDAVAGDVLAWVTVYALAWVGVVLGLGLASFRSPGLPVTRAARAPRPACSARGALEPAADRPAERGVPAPGGGPLPLVRGST